MYKVFVQTGGPFAPPPALLPSYNTIGNEVATKLIQKGLARVPLQNLIMKFFPEISLALLCRVMGI